jgi:hypothetical protein
VGSRDSVNGLEKRKISCHCPNSTSGSFISYRSLANTPRELLRQQDDGNYTMTLNDTERQYSYKHAERCGRSHASDSGGAGFDFSVGSSLS